jgi:hypothetical protein
VDFFSQRPQKNYSCSARPVSFLRAPRETARNIELSRKLESIEKPLAALFRAAVLFFLSETGPGKYLNACSFYLPVNAVERMGAVSQRRHHLYEGMDDSFIRLQVFTFKIESNHVAPTTCT